MNTKFVQYKCKNLMGGFYPPNSFFAGYFFLDPMHIFENYIIICYAYGSYNTQQLRRNLYYILAATDGIVPVAWKHSTIVPIFKKGSRHVALNYRLISLTSICSKTLERVVADCLYEYLNSNSLLSPSQYGFRQGRTVDN